MLAYFGWKCQWPPLYACISDMPVEVGEVFFMCLSWDQAKEQQERMEADAKRRAEELIRSLHPNDTMFRV